MGVGWIDDIFNNSSSTWRLKSVDDSHNGVLQGGGESISLDDGALHDLKPATHYAAEWCGIPWFYQGKHYKAFSHDGQNSVSFYTSEIGGQNWIIYQDAKTGRQVARQSAPFGSDFHCLMRFEENGVWIDIVNNNAFSGENALYQVFDEAKQWVQVLGPIIAAALKSGAEAD